MLMCESRLGAIWVIVTQTHAELFRPFLRHNFGRRFLGFKRAFVLPMLILAAAFAMRMAMPHTWLYAPLQLLPPYAGWPEYQALIASQHQGMPERDIAAFAAFQVLVLALWLIHWLVLRLKILRKRDVPNTWYYGTAWLWQLPGLNGLSQRVVQGVFEPLLLLAIGYGFCAVAPAFGLFLMAGGVLLAIEDVAYWMGQTEQELDARDAFGQAAQQELYHARAQAFIEQFQQRVGQQEWGAESAIAQIQSQAHDLLRLNPEETHEVRQVLGTQQFDALVEALPQDLKQVVYDRLPGGTAPPLRSKTA